jgi:hypothetical protein
MKSKYVVECGSEKAEYSDLENAIAKAWEMAMELADGEISFDINDDGAYWPTVTLIGGSR